MVSAHFKVGDVRCKASTFNGREGVVTSIDYSDKLPRYIVTWKGGKMERCAKNKISSEAEFFGCEGPSHKKQRVERPSNARVVTRYISGKESDSISEAESVEEEEESSDEGYMQGELKSDEESGVYVHIAWAFPIS